jgi:hypothetical protein
MRGDAHSREVTHSGAVVRVRPQILSQKVEQRLQSDT